MQTNSTTFFIIIFIEIYIEQFHRQLKDLYGCYYSPYLRKIVIMNNAKLIKYFQINIEYFIESTDINYILKMYSGSRISSGGGQSQSKSITKIQSSSKTLKNDKYQQKSQPQQSRDHYLSFQYLAIQINKKCRQRKMYSLMKLSSNCLVSANKQQRKMQTVQKLSYITKSKIMGSKAFFLNQLLKTCSSKRKITHFCKLLGLLQQRKRKSYLTISFRRFCEKALKSKIKSLTVEQVPTKMIKNPTQRSLRDSRSSDSQYDVTSSQREFRSKSIAQGSQSKSKFQSDKTQKELSWFKLMSLSQQIRSEFTKLQRYDKKALLKLSTQELLLQQIKRLEKIKVSNKEIKNKIFDSQLVSKILQNHMKLVSELNEELAQVSSWKKQKLEEQSKTQSTKFLALEKEKTKLKENLLVQLQADNIMASKQVINNFTKKFENQQNCAYEISLMSWIRKLLEKQQQIIQDQNRANKVDLAKQRLIKQQNKQRQIIKNQLSSKNYANAKKTIELFCKKYQNDENLILQRELYTDMNSLITENMQLTIQLNGKSVEKQLQKMKKEKEQLNKSLQKQKNKNEQFLRSHNSLTSKVRELQKSLQSEKSQLNRSNLGSKSIDIIKQHQNISVTSSVNSMSRYIRSEHRDEVIQQLRSQITQLKKQNQNEKSQIAKLNKQIVDRNNILSDLSDRLVDLQQTEALLNNETCNTQQELKLQKQAQKQVGIIENQLKTKNYSFAKKNIQGFIKNYSHLVKFVNELSLYKYILTFLEEIQKLKQIEKQNKVCQRNLAQAKRAVIREKQLQQNLQELKASIRTQQQPLKDIEEILTRINNQYQKMKNWQRISIKKPSTQLSSSMQIIYILLQGCKSSASQNSNLKRKVQSLEKSATKGIQFEKDLTSTIQLLRKCQNIIRKKQYLKDDSVWSRAIDEKNARKDIANIFMQIVNMLLNQGKGIWMQQKKKLQETIQKLEADYKISQGRAKKLQQDLKHNRIQIQDLNNTIQELREKLLRKEQQQRQSRKAEQLSEAGSTNKRRFSRNSQEKIPSSRQQTPRSSMNAQQLMQGYIEQQKKMLEKISELQNKIQQLEHQNIALVEQLQKNIEGTKILQEEYLSEMVEIKKKLQNYKLSETDSQEIKAMQFKLSIINEQLKQCQQKLRITEEKLRKKNQQYINIQEQLANKKKEVMRFEDKIQQKDNLLTQSRNLYIGLQQLFDQRQRQISQLKQYINKFQHESNNKLYSFETLKQNYSLLQRDIQMKLAEKLQLQKNYNQLQRKLTDKNEELNQMRASYSEIERIVISRDSEIVYLKSRFNNEQSPKINMNMNQNDNYKELLKKNQQYLSQKYSLQHQLTIKVQEINKLKSLINKHSLQVNHSQHQLSKIKDQLNQKSQKLTGIVEQKYKLEDKISKLQRQINKWKQQAQLFEKQFKYYKQQLTMNEKSDNKNLSASRNISQMIEKDRKISQLMHQCDTLKKQTSQKIQKALKIQQEQFNQFLKKNDMERNNYYQTVIFPQWKKLWYLQQNQRQKVVQQVPEKVQSSNRTQQQFKRQLQSQVQTIKLEIKKQKEFEINKMIELNTQQFKIEMEKNLQQERKTIMAKYMLMIEEKLIEKQKQVNNRKQNQINSIQQHYKQVITDLEQRNIQIMKKYGSVSDTSTNQNKQLILRFQSLQRNYDELLYEKKSIKKELNQALSQLNKYNSQIESIRQQKSQLQTIYEQKLERKQRELRTNYNIQIQRIKTSYKEQPLLKEKEEIILLHKIIDNQQVQLQQMRNFIKMIDSNTNKKEQSSKSSINEESQLRIKNIEIDHTKKIYEIKSEYEIKVSGLQKELQQYKRRYQQAQQKIQLTRREFQINHKNMLQEEKFRINSDFQKKIMQMEANLTIKQNQMVYAHKENNNLSEDIKNLRSEITELKSELNRSQSKVSELKNKLYEHEYNSKFYQENEVSYKRQISMLQKAAEQTKKHYENSLYQLKQQIKQKASLLLNKEQKQSPKLSQVLNDKILLQNQIHALKQQNKKYKGELQRMDSVIKQNRDLIYTIEELKKKSQKQFEQPYIGSAYQSNYTNSKRRIKEFYEDYDQAQMMALKKINQQVSDLVEANRKLQLKLSLYENSAQLNAYNSDIINFFLIIENRLQKLINYLLDKMMIENSDSYKLFLQRSRKHLQTINIQQYFDSFQMLLKNLFRDAHMLQVRQIESKAKQMMQLKQQMSEILEKQIQLNQEENQEFSNQQKYVGSYNNGEHELMSQIKQLIQQFIETRDQRILRILQTHLASVESF